jgi:hypothetical protein
MQNIDLIFVLQPVIVVVFSVALIVYWRLKRTFKWSVLLYAFIAYVVAIALKYALQLLTAPSVLDTYGAQSVATGIYYGLQTVFFEVGIAYVVAWYATSKSKLDAKDAEAYGLSLAFYENGLLLGLHAINQLAFNLRILSSNTPIGFNSV